MEDFLLELALFTTEEASQAVDVKDVMAFWGLIVSALGLIATTAVSIANILNGRRRDRELQVREDRLRHDTLVREDELRRIQRTLVPRADVDLECRFLGPEKSGDKRAYITEIRIIVHNRGLTRRNFRSVHVRLRGVRKRRGALLLGRRTKEAPLPDRKGGAR
jgi:hypothetical protein